MSGAVETTDDADEWVDNPDGPGLVRRSLVEWWNETTTGGRNRRQKP